MLQVANNFQSNLVFIMLNLLFVSWLMHQPFYIQFIFKKKSVRAVP